MDVYLGLGSNLDPEANLRLGIRALRKRYGELLVSPVYRSTAVGFDGDDFLNLVVRLSTDEAPESIRDELERIHDLAGRDRSAPRFGDRALDIDLLIAGDRLQSEPFELPRADVLEYAFVLKPLADIAPDYVHPGNGRRIADIWAGFDAESQPLKRVDVTF